MAVVSVASSSIDGGERSRSRSIFGVYNPEELGGMVLLTPTSVDKAGTGSTATIGANGSVEFSACTSLSLNGVFSATYDNYMIVCRNKNTTTAQIEYRLRASGSDVSTSTYTYQSLYGDGTTVAGYRDSNMTAGRAMASYTSEAGFTMNVYGPFLAQPTAFRTVVIDSRSVAFLDNLACTQSNSTSYDGITFIVGSGSLTGLISVYGLVGA